jgi:hypothetical protein
MSKNITIDFALPMIDYGIIKYNCINQEVINDLMINKNFILFNKKNKKKIEQLSKNKKFFNLVCTKLLDEKTLKRLNFNKSKTSIQTKLNTAKLSKKVTKELSNSSNRNYQKTQLTKKQMSNIVKTVLKYTKKSTQLQKFTKTNKPNNFKKFLEPYQKTLITSQAGGNMIIFAILLFIMSLFFGNSNLLQLKDIEFQVTNALNKKGNPVDDYRRMVWFISLNGKTYYIKIAQVQTETPLDEKNCNKNYLEAYPLDYRHLGNYIYEARIYEELNKKANQIRIDGPNSDKVSKYVTSIYDWNVVRITYSGSEFYVNIKGTKINLNKNITNNISSQIRQNNWGHLETHVLNDYYSYIITENTNSYSDLMSSLRIMPKILQKTAINNAMKLLHKCFEHCGFVHWDFHGGNILVDTTNGNIKLYDFDFSEIDIKKIAGVTIRSKSRIYDAFYFDKLLEHHDIRNTTPEEKKHIIKYMGHFYDYHRLMYDVDPETIRRAFNIKGKSHSVYLRSLTVSSYLTCHARSIIDEKYLTAFRQVLANLKKSPNLNEWEIKIIEGSIDFRTCL